MIPAGTSQLGHSWLMTTQEPWWDPASFEPSIRKMIAQVGSGVSSQKAFSEWVAQMLDGPRIREVIDEVECAYSEAALEQIG